MKQRLKQNSGFSLIELIIAIAVLSFLMLAVSSFMGSSVIQTRKAKVEVRLQTQAQETYSLITDSIMQASEILVAGYIATDDSKVSFSKAGDDGETISDATFTKYFFVKDSNTKKKLIENKAYFGVSDAVGDGNVFLFSDLATDSRFKDKNLYVSYIRIESAVPFKPENSTKVTNASTQKVLNDITGEMDELSFTDNAGVRIYNINDTLVSSFYFDGNNLYYGREYAFMDKLDDSVDMTDNDSKKAHLYNKYFSYKVSEGKNIPGCVASINAKDGTIGIDLYYNQSSMTYTTLGRINTRNSYVLKSKK